jgi:hypothetical protein
MKKEAEAAAKTKAEASSKKTDFVLSMQQYVRSYTSRNYLFD